MSKDIKKNKTKNSNIPKYKTVQEKYLEELNDAWSSYSNSGDPSSYENDFQEWTNQRIHYSFKSKFEFKIGDLVFVKTTQPLTLGGSGFSLSSTAIINYPYPGIPSTHPSTMPGVTVTPSPPTTIPQTTPASQPVAVPAGTVTAPIWNYGHTTSGKLGMSTLSNPLGNGNTTNKVIVTVSSSSLIQYKPSSYGVSTANVGTFTKYTDDFVAFGYKTLDDLIRSRNAVSVKQESTWTDEEKKEMATTKNNPYWTGKPFVGIVVDRYIPKNVTDNGEEITSVGEISQLTHAYKVLFDENHCYWFSVKELFPMKKEQFTKNKETK